MIVEERLQKIAIASRAESKEAIAWLGIDSHSEESMETGKYAVFEARKNYDYIFLSNPDIEAFVTLDKLAILSDEATSNELKDEIFKDDAEDPSPGRGLYLLLNRVFKGTWTLLDDIEGEIEKMEEDSADRKPKDNTTEYIDMRKRLLSLKKFYTAILELYEDMEENTNGLFSQNRLKAFRIQRNRAGRILSRILGLQDYLSHVREAYQNQLAISLNETMQFFTVITVVFLPPTLIVGWYGMNLAIPEMKYPLTYPLVVVFILVSVALSLIYSKKKGWF